MKIWTPANSKALAVAQALVVRTVSFYAHPSCPGGVSYPATDDVGSMYLARLLGSKRTKLGDCI